MFNGVYTAVVTPFKKGKVDYEALGRIIEFSLQNGVSGIVPCGTTGEAPTLSEEEHLSVVSFTVEKVKGRGHIIAGAGSNSTKKTVVNARAMKEIGADAVLVVTPYYNKPTQRGLKLHYEILSGEVDIPIIVYNVPGRTSVNVLSETLEEIARLKNIAGVKEASGNLAQIADIKRRCPDSFSVLSGDDQLFLPTLAVGGDGIISVASNVIPGEMSEIYSYFKKNRTEEARKLFLRFMPLLSGLFLETNPIPVKSALSAMGYIENELRLPLCPMGDDNQKKLGRILKEFKLV